MSDDFDAWWALYPRKVGKKGARTAWRNLTKTNQRAAMHHLPEHIDYWERAGRGTETIPHPTSWLHAEAWNDELTPIRPSAAPARTSRPERNRQVLDAFVARHEQPTQLGLPKGPTP